MTTPVQRTHQIIRENLYMVIATASKTGMPWISPVYFASDSKLNFYWSSSKNSMHSRLINKNKNVAVVVFNSAAAEGTGNAVYMTGKASEVSGKEIQHGLNLLYNRTGKTSKYFKNMTSSDYTGSSPVRIYKFVPRKFWMLGESVRIKGKLVDRKKEILFKR